MTVVFNIEGMSCMMCAGHVKTALEGVRGVSSAKVSLDEKLAVVDYESPANTDQMIEAVVDEGYEATLKA